ncbi:MAG TPA: hypothetical protein VF345_15225 [Chthoniobacterales bacterium]
MKTPPVEGWEPTKVTYPVAIPTLDGKSVDRTVEIELDAWRDADGEIFLDGDAEEKIDAVKTRHMGLLTPAEIKEIRVSTLDATQKEISTWLQIGEKTWTRWESGRERPSRSMNVFLCALRDRKIDASYLEGLRFGRKLGRLVEAEHLSSISRVIQYDTHRRKFGSRQVSPPVRAKKARFALDSSVVLHYAAAAQIQAPQESPWASDELSRKVVGLLKRFQERSQSEPAGS